MYWHSDKWICSWESDAFSSEFPENHFFSYYFSRQRTLECLAIVIWNKQFWLLWLIIFVGISVFKISLFLTFLNCCLQIKDSVLFRLKKNLHLLRIWYFPQAHQSFRKNLQAFVLIQVWKIICLALYIYLNNIKLEHLCYSLQTLAMFKYWIMIMLFFSIWFVYSVCYYVCFLQHCFIVGIYLILMNQDCMNH